MLYYCVNTNAQATGEREVHDTVKYCAQRPIACQDLGSHANCQSEYRQPGVSTPTWMAARSAPPNATHAREVCLT